MDKIKIWLKEIRAPFLTASIVPVILGTAIAWNQFHLFNLLYFSLALIGVCLCHIGTNVANDYFDHTSGDDEANKTPTPFSGGSRMIQNKLLPAKHVLIGATIAFILCAIIGLYLNSVTGGKVVLIIGIIGIFLGFFYTASPIRIGYRGWAFGETAVGLGFGPLAVIGSYYVQTQRLDWVPALASIPVGILIALVLYINEFPDYDADKSVNKMTLPVMFGKKRAVILYDVFTVLTFVWVIAGVIFNIFPIWSLLPMLTLPISLKAITTLHKHYSEIYPLMPANAMTIILHLSFGLLFSLGFFIGS
jgi:1,4-dihydroxy-2-naphthoate octaprenyltransferase